MVNVMLCMFYHNLREKKRQASARWLRKHRGRQSQQGTGLPLEKAERLLRNPRQDICAIAGLCGWSSGSVLRKIFKERHGGLSMREWRARAVADASGAPCAKPSVSVARERRSARG